MTDVGVYTQVLLIASLSTTLGVFVGYESTGLGIPKIQAAFSAVGIVFTLWVTAHAIDKIRTTLS